MEAAAADLACDTPRARASRLNGSRSRGPVSEEGKRRAARNAVRHGLWSENIHVCMDEDKVLFKAMHDALFEEWAPLGMIEALLVNEIMVLTWRLARCSALEVRRLDLGHAYDPYDQINPPPLELVTRYRKELTALLLKLVRELEARQAARGVDAAADRRLLAAAEAELAAEPAP
ncbi:MAG TPA: hypothetical protein VFG43_08175, partial [Geminicoccaceae bacterium]|nr:hypothetical protein [Geminicoccaceae bacterium]